MGLSPLIAVWCAYVLTNGSGGMLRASRWHKEPGVRILDGGAHKMCARMGIWQEAYKVFGKIRWSKADQRILRRALRIYNGANLEPITSDEAGRIHKKLMRAMHLARVDISGLIEGVVIK